MSFGLNFFNAAGDLRWAAENHIAPIVDAWVVAYNGTLVKDYPELTGATIRAEVNPARWVATVTYPGGVPTVTITTPGSDYAFYGTVYVFLVSLPASLEPSFGYRILNADGSNAISPINTTLELAEVLTTTAAGNRADACDVLPGEIGVTATYVKSISKATYPSPPFIMIDLPEYPYFGGLLDVSDNFGSDTVNWTVRLGGSFAAAPDIYLFTPRAAGAAPTSGMGIVLYDASENALFTSNDNLLGFTGPPETPPIDELTVPASPSSTDVITGQDQYWTAAAPMPANALIWMQSRQLMASEECTIPPFGFPGGRIVREWTTGICRYDSTSLMMRLYLRTNYPRGGGDLTFRCDVTNGEPYTGSIYLTDKGTIV